MSVVDECSSWWNLWCYSNLLFLQGSQIPSFACVCSWICLGSRLLFFWIRWWHTSSWWALQVEAHPSNCWCKWSLFNPFDFTSFPLLSQFLITHHAKVFYPTNFILLGKNDYFTFIMSLHIIQFVFKLPPANIWNVMAYCWKSVKESVIWLVDSFAGLNLPMFEHAYDLHSKQKNISNKE